MPKRTEPAESDDESYNTVMTTYKVIKRASLGLVSDEALTQSQVLCIEGDRKERGYANEEDE